MLKSIKDDKLFFISKNICAIHGTAKNMFVPDLARHQFILRHFNHVVARISRKIHEITAAQQSAIVIHTWHNYFFVIKTNL